MDTVITTARITKAAVPETEVDLVFDGIEILLQPEPFIRIMLREGNGPQQSIYFRGEADDAAGAIDALTAQIAKGSTIGEAVFALLIDRGHVEADASVAEVAR